MLRTCFCESRIAFGQRKHLLGGTRMFLNRYKLNILTFVSRQVSLVRLKKNSKRKEPMDDDSDDGLGDPVSRILAQAAAAEGRTASSDRQPLPEEARLREGADNDELDNSQDEQHYPSEEELGGGDRRGQQVSSITQVCSQFISILVHTVLKHTPLHLCLGRHLHVHLQHHLSLLHLRLGIQRALLRLAFLHLRAARLCHLSLLHLQICVHHCVRLLHKLACHLGHLGRTLCSFNHLRLHLLGREPLPPNALHCKRALDSTCLVNALSLRARASLVVRRTRTQTSLSRRKPPLRLRKSRPQLQKRGIVGDKTDRYFFPLLADHRLFCVLSQFPLLVY